MDDATPFSADCGYSKLQANCRAVTCTTIVRACSRSLSPRTIHE